jgi:hypothetical protein
MANETKQAGLPESTSRLADALIAAPLKSNGPQRVVGMKSGETYEQAVARVARQKAAIAKATGSAS